MTTTNHFVIKSFFRITWLLAKKNWADSHSFKSVVEFVAACGREEIKKHLLHAPENANYMSPEYISKYIQIMDDHIKLPLLASLRFSGLLTFLLMKLRCHNNRADGHLHYFQLPRDY